MAPSCQLYACPLRFALPACSVIAQEVLRSHTLPGVVQTLAHVGVLARLWPGTLLAFFIVVSGQTPCWAAAESSLPPGDTSAPCTPSRWPCLSRPSRSPPVLCSWGWLAASLWLNYPEALHPTWTPPPPPFHPGPSTPALPPRPFSSSDPDFLRHHLPAGAPGLLRRRQPHHQRAHTAAQVRLPAGTFPRGRHERWQRWCCHSSCLRRVGWWCPVATWRSMIVAARCGNARLKLGWVGVDPQPTPLDIRVGP